MALLENDIYIGSVSNPLYHFTNRSIEIGSAKGAFSVDVLGNELSIDTFTVVIRNRFDLDLVYAPIGKNGYRDTNGKIYRSKRSGTPQYFYFIPSGSDQLHDANDDIFRVFGGYISSDYLNVPYGTPVYWYVSGGFYAKAYLKNVDRIGKYSWKLTCISGVGLLDTMMHVGGLYTGQSFLGIARSIVGDAFAFNCQSDVGSTRIYGHLPYDTARNNLHSLLFAVGAVMVKSSASYDYTIRWPDKNAVNIPSSRIALGGSVNYDLPANVVEVIEHGFYSSSNDELVTLFDNSAASIAAVNQLVIFDKSPIRSLTTTGTLTINSSGVNYAYVSGSGTLTGRVYTHTQQIVRISERRSSDAERLKRVTGNELVSSTNSMNVARRVLSYFRNAKNVKAKMLLQRTEKPGQSITTLDAFGEAVNAIMASATVVPTTVLGAEIQLITGYDPIYNGNNYLNRVEITQSGTWTVPAGVTTIRLILVGGGSGGSGGYDGKPGLAGTRSFPDHMDRPMDVDVIEHEVGPPDCKLYYVSTQPPQSGGAGGAGGEQGSVYAVDIAVSPGTNIPITVGIGGAGGQKNGGAGSVGTATTASVGNTVYSSENGTTEGYYDPVGRKSYGLAGKRGYNGGAGGTSGGEGDPSSKKYSGCDGGNGVNGRPAGGFQGGAGGVGTGYDGEHYPATTSRGTNSGLSNYIFLANGSGGGGAAYGNNGQPGGTYSITESWDGNIFLGFDIGNALGGAGADAIAPAKSSYGNGGSGGNGGGGGGNASGVYCYHAAYENYYPGGWPVNTAGNTGASGGSGSVGGDGGDGCVVVLY